MLDHMPEVRRALLLALARNGPQTVHELAPQVFTSVTSARAALTAMLDEGLVSVTDRVVGRGRPWKVYGLTDQGWRLFPDRSGLYATALLRLLEIHEEEAFQKALDVVRQDTVDVIHRRTGLPPGLRAMEETLKLAFEDGWGVDGVTGDNTITAQFFYCPVLRLARVFPVLCKVHSDTLSDVAGAPASLGEHILAGDRRCVFTMRFEASEGACDN